MGRMLRAVVAFGFICALADVSIAETVAFNANANPWSSSTASNPSGGIYPIGGSGQVDGGFVVGTDSAGNEIAIRAELRNVGPTLSQTNDGIHTAAYTAPTGSPSGNLALWNFDFDINLKQAISNYTAILTITDGAKVTPINLVTSGLVPSNAVLYQNSENPGFNFLSTELPGFNPNASQDYSFDLTLTPNSGGESLDVAMNVDAVAPLPGVLPVAGLALAGFIAFSLLRRRKLAI